MNPYVIYTDVSADLDADFAANHSIGFIQMEYSLGDEMRVCAQPENADVIHRFYEGQRNGDLTKTSQVTPQKYAEAMRPVLAGGQSVLCLCLSSGLSNTYQSACLAAEQLKDEFPGQSFLPVDSLSATGGMNVLLERAIRNRDAGMSLEENAADLIELRSKVMAVFMVQDLMYLKRGGRVSAATAVVGSVLNVKPILHINREGKLDTVAKSRGTKGAMRELMTRFSSAYNANGSDVIYVIDADARDVGDALKDEIMKQFPNAVVRQASLSPIIGAHTGPGMAAICFAAK